MKTAEIVLEYMPYIPGPPVAPWQLNNQACSNDLPTIEHWRPVWADNVKKNHDLRGPFAKNSLAKLHKISKYRPAIVCGSGPSLVKNAHHLKKAKDMTIVSCLHNFHYFADNEIPCQYFVTLDAGHGNNLAEIAEGGKKSLDEYLELTKDKTLLAFVGAAPDVISKWKGEILWFSANIPDERVMREIEGVEKFYVPISTGGNVLGGCFYIAKVVMGANPIIFTGADMSFSYKKEFYGWKNNTDKNGIGNTIRMTDIYGVKTHTWGSYANFKAWFESKFCTVPGDYVNCTEGGILGAYDQGNIMQLKQMDLEYVINMYNMCDHLDGEFNDLSTLPKKLLF